MAKGRKRRGGKSGAGRSGSRRTVVVETAVGAIERNLGLSGDACVLHGKVLFSTGAITSPVQILVLAPINLGVRAAAFNALYARYRFKQVSIRFFAASGSGTSGTTGQGVLGIVDDATSAEGDIPTTPSGVAELRTSGTNFISSTVASELLWKPTTNEWYYCYQGQSGSDNRLVNAGMLYGACTFMATIAIEINYSVVFKSAVDVGSS